jgi:hypothetical protein
MTIMPKDMHRRIGYQSRREECNARPRDGGLDYISTAIEITELKTAHFEEMGHMKDTARLSADSMRVP